MPLLPAKAQVDAAADTVVEVAKENWGAGLTFLIINAVCLGISAGTLAQPLDPSVLPVPTNDGAWMYLATAAAAAIAQGFALLVATVKANSKSKDEQLVRAEARAVDAEGKLVEERERRIAAETRITILDAARSGEWPGPGGS